MVKPMVFLVVTYGCDSWTIKEAERQTIESSNCGEGEGFFSFLSFFFFFEQALKRPLDSRSWNKSTIRKSILNIHRKDWCLRLKPQYFGFFVCWTNSLARSWCWERLKAKGEGSDRRWEGWISLLTQCRWIWANSRHWRRIRKPGLLHSIRSKSSIQLSHWSANNKNEGKRSSGTYIQWNITQS